MKVEIQAYKKSISETSFTDGEVALIWDFYVTKSIAESSGQKRKVSDYGIKNLPFKKMLETAGVSEENKKVLLANTINKTLQNFDLEIVEGSGNNKRSKAIEIDVPQIVCLTPYSISDEELPKAKVGEAESVLTHIRNSFAHGNTYFFDNGFVLLKIKTKEA